MYQPHSGQRSAVLSTYPHLWHRPDRRLSRARNLMGTIHIVRHTTAYKTVSIANPTGSGCHGKIRISLADCAAMLDAPTIAQPLVV
ncbi:MAG: hypothetical protein KAS72_08590 [Phycisphaerales bacterium]|nr:hypothetical protein [Phycisphaerales bacterium]